MLSVKEALLKANRDILISEYINMLSKDVDANRETIVVSKWLDSILTLQEQRDINAVIVVDKNVSDFPDEKDYEYIDTSLLHIDELKMSKIRIPNIEENEVWNMPEEEVDFLLPLPSLPQTYAFEFCDWEEILGYSISQSNIDEYGLEAILAGVIYEMTFFGYERTDMEEEREELHNRIQEVNEIFKQPEEEQKKHFISGEEIFKQLNYVDERSEEEIKAEHLYMLQSMLINNLRRAKSISKIKEEVEKEEKEND